MIPLINHDSSEGEQWGRYNLPRYVCIGEFQTTVTAQWCSAANGPQDFLPLQ